MIIINKNIQGDKFINEKNFPLLFVYNDELQRWVQTAEFYIFFDGVDFQVETTLRDSEKIFELIKDYIQKRKTLMKQAIKTAQDEINAINKILKVNE